MDWVDVHDRLRSYLNLATSPVGVRLYEDESVARSLPGTRMVGRTSLCKMALMARCFRDDGVVVSTAKEQRCVWGAANVGMMRSPKRLTDGSLYIPYSKDAETAANLHRSVDMLGDTERRYSGVMMAPLDMMPDEPQAVVMYLTSGQALRVILGTVYGDGEPIRTEITGQCSLCTSINKAIEHGRVSLDVPCVGDRRYGLVGDDELVMVLPAGKMEDVMLGLKATEAYGSHPFRPNIEWGVSMPRPYMPYPDEI